MRSTILKSALIVTITLTAITGCMAQRVIKGIVYKDGEPFAGVTVEAHKGGSMMTSFDGVYQVEASVKTKWLKFTFIDEAKKLTLEENSGDNIDFYWDGKKPAKQGNNENVCLKSMDELKNERNMEFINEYTLYYEFQKQKDYKSALPHWEKIYNKFPRSTKNIYIHGVTFYKSFLENASTLEEKEKYLKKMMEIYDQRIEHFQQKGYVLGRKGIAWLDHYLNNDDVTFEDRKEAMKVGYQWLRESVDEQGVKTEIPVLVVMMNISTQLFKLEEQPKETVVKDFDFISKLTKQMLENDGAGKEKITEAQDYIEKMFGVSGAADCEALINIYKPQFKETPNDIDFLKKMLSRLRKSKCDESDLYIQATEKLYSVEPSAEAAFNMARRFLKQNNVEKAKEYYKQAMGQETNEELLAEYYYEYGLFIYAKEEAFQEARSYARKALAINPNYCEALVLIGNIYVAASSSFGENNFDKATVFWLAVDYFKKAARVSEDCIAEASKNASFYEKYFPGKEDVFFQGLSEGETYRIGGWINESTKVRF